MKHASLLALLLAGCAGGSHPQSSAPDFEVKSLDGSAVKGSSLWSRRPVLLVFMTSW